MSEENTTGRRIGLPEAVAQLRADLSAARREGEGKDVRFSVKEIEVELGVEFGWTTEGGGGLKLFSFVDVSGKLGSSDKATHRVKLKLAIDPDGEQSPGLISKSTVMNFDQTGDAGHIGPKTE